MELDKERPALTPAAGKPKRRRLNVACNNCRSRKTRCDEQKPSCHACVVAGVPCITTDKRRPGVVAERRHTSPGGPGNASTASIEVAAWSPESLTAGPEPSVTSTQGARTGSPLPQNPLGAHRRSVSEVSGAPVAFRAAGQDDLRPPASLPLDSWTGGSPPPQRPLGMADSAWASSVPTEAAEGDYLTGENPSKTGNAKFLGRLPLGLRGSGRNSLEILTGWLDIAFFRLGMPQNFRAQTGLHDITQPRQLPSTLAPPTLPSANESQVLLAVYARDVHPVIPAIHMTKLQEILQSALKDGPGSLIRTGHLQSLLLLYLVLCLALMHSPSRNPEAGLIPEYISFCKTFLGHAVVPPSLEAVQAIYFLSVILKYQDQTASAWSMLGLCVSMATSISLNRKKALLPPHGHSPAPGLDDEDNERRRTWWNIYCFEKVFAFEFGRPSTIRDQDCNQPMPQTSKQEPSDFFLIMISFAKLMSGINKDGLRVGNREEVVDNANIETVIADKIRVMGESLTQLIKWADNLPEGYKPNSFFLGDPSTFSRLALISAQYNNALIILTLNSFLVSEKAKRHALEVIAKDKPWSHLVRSGPSIAADAARMQIKMLIEAADRDNVPVLFNLVVPFLAVLVLATHLVTHPGSRLTSSDLSLLQNGADFAKQQYERFNNDKKLHDVLMRLEAVVTQCQRLHGVNRRMSGSGTEMSFTGSDVQLTSSLQGGPAFPVQFVQQTGLEGLVEVAGELEWDPWFQGDIWWDWQGLDFGKE